MEKIMILKKPCVKHLAVLLLTGALSLPAMARNSSNAIIYKNKNCKKTYRVEEKVFNKKNYFQDLFIDLGYNRLDKSNIFTGAEHRSAKDFPKLKNSTSTSFSIYSMFGRKISTSFSIMSGLGFDWVNYRFSKSVTIKEIDGMAMAIPISSFIENFSHMKKSKLTGSYLNVPVLLKLKFRRFFVAAGVTGGVNLGSHTKIVYTGTTGKKDTYKDYNIHLATFRYGYSMRAGFRTFSLFANYYVSPLFARDEGPQVYPFTIGLSLKL